MKLCKFLFQRKTRLLSNSLAIHEVSEVVLEYSVIKRYFSNVFYVMAITVNGEA